MGMYCCCDRKISSDHFECVCDWKEWNSRCDFPTERKNKDNPVCDPLKDGKYLVRIQTCCGDRYEDESYFTIKSRIENCEYTGDPQEVHWTGGFENQPYAWKEMEKN